MASDSAKDKQTMKLLHNESNIPRMKITRRRQSTDSIESDQENFKIPKKISKRPRTEKQLTTATSNKYNILSDTDNTETETNTENDTQRTKERKPKPPPPVVLHGKPENHKELIKNISKTAKKYKIAYTAKNTNIHFEDREERIKYMKTLEQEKTNFHTYTDTTDKTHAYVIHGLHRNIPTEEIKSEINSNHNIMVKNCYQMKTKGSALYLLITSQETTLNIIRQKIKHIMLTRVYFERHYNKRILTQCRRCQEWGHATSNCYCLPRCLKCAKAHITSECTKTPDTPAKCTNCSAHPANYLQCEYYLSKLKALDNRQIRKTNSTSRDADFHLPALAPAPTPTTNVWKQRAEQANRNTSYNNQQIPQTPPPTTYRTQLQSPQKSKTLQQTQVSASAQSNEHTNLNTLQIELAELNTLINVKAMINAVRDLNAQLRNCTSQLEKFLTFNNFTQNINSYGL